MSFRMKKSYALANAQRASEEKQSDNISFLFDTQKSYIETVKSKKSVGKSKGKSNSESGIAIRTTPVAQIDLM
jgi:hypothetical protein